MRPMFLALSTLALISQTAPAAETRPTAGTTEQTFKYRDLDRA
jgi:hypothetical protein